MKRTILTVTAAVIALLSCCILIACGGKKEITADKSLTVTLLDGEHYSVVGENKRAVSSGESVTFTVSLERGYKIVGAYGDECEISDEKSFEQTVKIVGVQYKSTVRLETAEMERTPFGIESDPAVGNVTISSALGQAEENIYYADDIIDVTAEANDGYRFQCWSKGGFMNGGGEFYDYNDSLENIDVVSVDKLYANFKSLADTGNTIIYRTDGGREIEQDVTQLLEHHARANTYTAVDMRELGVDCDSRYLAGWTTDGGEYIGLGSRVTVSDKTATVLTAVWKEYTDASLFEVNQGGGVRLITPSTDIDEIVVPREINGTAVTTICQNAFSGCAASTYYIPDSVTTIEDNAFDGCENLTDFYMSDNIMTISDKSFSGCKNFTTLHLNAYLLPRYSTEEPSVATNVYDRLAYNADNDLRKLVFLGGSSVKYGYCCYVAEELFNEEGRNIDVYNLGYNASYSSFAQYQVLSKYLKSGDIFLHAPEQFKGSLHGPSERSPLTDDLAVQLQGAYYIWRLCEGNWDFISSLTVNEYCNLFDKFKEFNSERAGLPEKSYSGYFERMVGPRERGLRVTNEAAYDEWNRPDRINWEMLDFELFDLVEKAKTRMYEPLIEAGVNVYVTFPPIKDDHLVKLYGSMENSIEVVDTYADRVKEILSSLDLTVLLTQSDMIYEGIHFVEHDMHLGDPYRNTHTEKVISALIAAMKSEGRL